MSTKPGDRSNSSARFSAVKAVAEFLRGKPDFHAVEPNVWGLEERDARLATAIYRTTVQRWLTLDFLLNRFLRKKLELSPPGLRAVLLSGAAQLIFMDKLPAHAVVDEAVKLARRMGHASATGVVNAVLHKVAAMAPVELEEGGWEPSPHAVPIGGGRLKFAEAWLPPVKTLDRYLAVATSHPLVLVQKLLEQFDRQTAVRLLHHSHAECPTIVYTPSPPPPCDAWVPHDREGFGLWRGDVPGLARFLHETGGWVQDPASQKAVAATSGCDARLIVDYCAGKGTKTRQLAHVHPQAEILAADTDATRARILQETFAGHTRVKVLPHDQFASYKGQADLLLLDVPCSNTGVLARRIEARYRYAPQSIAALVELQRGIFDRSVPLLKSGGLLLYSTCSLDRAENEQQARCAADRFGMTLLQEQTLLPAGLDATYHDGSYFAILRAGK